MLYESQDKFPGVSAEVKSKTIHIAPEQGRECVFLSFHGKVSCFLCFLLMGFEKNLFARSIATFLVPEDYVYFFQ